MTNTAALAVAAAVAPLAMAAGCTCGGMLGGGDEDFYDGLRWCECCRTEMRPARPVLVNMIKISSREIMASHSVCTCGGPSGPGIEWCDYCLATIDWQPVIRLKPNRGPASGRPQEDGGLPVYTWWDKKFDELVEKYGAYA